ncbi:MAG: acyl carrier protein [Thermoanaerobaculia bacterium]
MREEEILQGIARVAREHLGWTRPLAAEMRLVEELRLDSLGLLTLAVEVENLFRVRLDEEDEAEIETVEDLVSAVKRKLPGGG